jgi:hypothetical protein
VARVTTPSSFLVEKETLVAYSFFCLRRKPIVVLRQPLIWIEAITRQDYAALEKVIMRAAVHTGESTKRQVVVRVVNTAVNAREV